MLFEIRNIITGELLGHANTHIGANSMAYDAAQDMLLNFRDKASWAEMEVDESDDIEVEDDYSTVLICELKSGDGRAIAAIQVRATDMALCRAHMAILKALDWQETWNDRITGHLVTSVGETLSAIEAAREHISLDRAIELMQLLWFLKKA